MGKRRREAAREQQACLDEWLAKATAPDANPAALHAEMEQWKQRDAELLHVHAPRLAPVTSTGRVERRPRERREQRHTARSTSSGDSGDPDGESPGEADAAYLRGFLLYLIGFDWSEALIDGAYAFSVEIEREVTS